MRKALCPAVLVLCLMVVGPAEAKLGAQATKGSIVPSDGGKTIELNASQAQTLFQRTDLMARVYGNGWDSPAPDGDLGPRYLVSYTVEAVDHARPNHTIETTIWQYLYPFADGGPRLRTPPGQSIAVPAGFGTDGVIEAGWMRVDSVTMDHFEFYGVARKAPPLATPRRDPTPPSWPLPVTLALILAAGAASITVRRMRGRGVPLPQPPR